MSETNNQSSIAGDWPSYFAYFGTALGTIAFLPQTYKVVKNLDTTGLVFSTFALLQINSMLWLVYGILTNDIPIIVSSTLGLVLRGAILFVFFRNKIKYGKFNPHEKILKKIIKHEREPDGKFHRLLRRFLHRIEPNTDSDSSDSEDEKKTKPRRKK